MSSLDIRHLDIARKAIWDNADYLELDDQAKAGKLQTALTRYILLTLEEASRGTGSESYREDLETKRAMLVDVKAFFLKKRSRTLSGFRLRPLTRMRLRP